MNNNGENFCQQFCENFKSYILIIFSLLFIFLKISSLGLIFTLGLIIKIGLPFAPLVDKTSTIALIGFYSGLLLAIGLLIYSIVGLAKTSHTIMKPTIIIILILVTLFFLYEAMRHAPLLTYISLELLFFFVVLTMVIFISNCISEMAEYLDNEAGSRAQIPSSFKRFFYKNLKKTLVTHIWFSLAITSLLTGMKYVSYIRFSEPQFILTTKTQYKLAQNKISLIIPANDGWIIANRDTLQIEYLPSKNILNLTIAKKIDRAEWEINRDRLVALQSIEKVYLKIIQLIDRVSQINNIEEWR